MAQLLWSSNEYPANAGYSFSPTDIYLLADGTVVLCDHASRQCALWRDWIPEIRDFASARFRSLAEAQERLPMLRSLP